MSKRTAIKIVGCIHTNWINPSRESVPPLTQPVHTRTQALGIKKPAGASNSAKARLPKFVVTLESKKGEREREGEREIESETSFQTEGMSRSSRPRLL